MEGWYYCRHCEQTLLSDDPEKCSACGMPGVVDPSQPGAVADLGGQKRDEGGPLADGGLESVRQVVRAIKMGVAAVFCICLGFALLTVPAFRSDPRVLSGTEIVYACGPLVVGAFLMALIALRYFLRK